MSGITRSGRPCQRCARLGRSCGTCLGPPQTSAGAGPGLDASIDAAFTGPQPAVTRQVDVNDLVRGDQVIVDGATMTVARVYGEGYTRPGRVVLVGVEGHEYDRPQGDPVGIVAAAAPTGPEEWAAELDRFGATVHPDRLDAVGQYRNDNWSTSYRLGDKPVGRLEIDGRHVGWVTGDWIDDPALGNPVRAAMARHGVDDFTLEHRPTPTQRRTRQEASS